LVRSSEAAFNAAIIWLYEPMVEACESDANRRLAGIRQRWTPGCGPAASECSIDRRGSGVASSLPGGWLFAPQSAVCGNLTSADVTRCRSSAIGAAGSSSAKGVALGRAIPLKLVASSTDNY
jgi:hypothetical protein